MPAGSFPVMRFNESEAESGTYEGQVDTPHRERCFRLRAVVGAPGERPVVLEEQIVIETPADQASQQTTDPF
jgi:hypothetical protein